MFTFGNIRSQQMGSLSRLKGETRSCFALAPPSHGTASERSERCLLIMIRNKGGSARKKKSEPKASGTVSRTPWGVDNRPEYPHRSDKIMSFF